jgi:YD repeat-containing protein
MLTNGTFRTYHYKGNVKTVYEVKIRKYLDTLGNEKIDTVTILFNHFDKNHRCLLMDYENRSYGSSAYQRFEIINGKYVMVESRGSFPIGDRHRIYSNDGKILEVHYPNAVELFNSQEKKYCTITYESEKSKKIKSYEYVYYDKKGRDTAIISMDRYFNVISHKKKVYDKRGKLTEEYKNGKLTSYHRYDTKGRLLSDSTSCGTHTYTYDSKGNVLTYHSTNDCIYAGENKLPTKISFEKYEYGKNGEKTVQEFVNGELDNIERYDKKGNRTYFRRYSCCPRIECKFKYNEKDEKIIDTTTYFNDNGIQTTYIWKYKNGEKDPLNRETYRNDTLIYIAHYEEKRVDNKLISTEINGVEDDTLKGKLHIDTITSVSTFDKDDKILTKCSCYNSTEPNCTRYTYNEQGQLLSVVHDKARRNDRYIWATRIDYQYNEHHNLVSETHWYGEKMVYQKTNHYDADNHLVESKCVESDRYYTLTKYDKVGNEIEEVRTSNGFEATVKSGKSTKVYKNPINILMTTYTYYDE